MLRDTSVMSSCCVCKGRMLYWWQSYLKDFENLVYSFDLFGCNDSKVTCGEKVFLIIKSFEFPIIGKILFETTFLVVHKGSRFSFQYLLTIVSKWSIMKQVRVSSMLSYGYVCVPNQFLFREVSSLVTVRMSQRYVLSFLCLCLLLFHFLSISCYIRLWHVIVVWSASKPQWKSMDRGWCWRNFTHLHVYLEEKLYLFTPLKTVFTYRQTLNFLFLLYNVGGRRKERNTIFWNRKWTIL